MLRKLNKLNAQYGGAIPFSALKSKSKKLKDLLKKDLTKKNPLN